MDRKKRHRKQRAEEKQLQYISAKGKTGASFGTTAVVKDKNWRATDKTGQRTTTSVCMTFYYSSEQWLTT